MTHTAKHTPGPWVVRNRDAVYAQSGRFVADCELTPYGSRPQPPNSIDEANANLIAASPAMYEALKHLVKVEELRLQATTENDYVDLVIADKHLQELAKAALAKAEGQQL